MRLLAACAEEEDDDDVGDVNGIAVVVVENKLGGGQNLEHSCTVSHLGSPSRRGSIRCKHTGQEGISNCVLRCTVVGCFESATTN